MFRFLTYLLLCIGFLSCGNKVIYSEKITLSEEGWSYEEPITFEAEVADTSEAFDLNLTVYHAEGYRFQNFYSTIETVFPDGSIINDTISFELTSDSNEWVGDCSGNNCKVEFTLQKGAFFKKSGHYTFRFAQHGRVDRLAGIQAIALTIENSKK